MATGQLEMTGAAEVEGDSSASAKGAATFGFTPAQQIMFQSSNMNGQRVVMVTPEVARSLGIVSSEEAAEPAAETTIQIQEDSADISVSVMDTEEDGMIDPDQFLAMELASGKAEAVVDEDLTSLSWLHSKQLLKASDVQFRSGSAAAAAAGAGVEGTPRAAAAAARRGPMSAAPLLVEETAVSEFSQESPTSDYLEELPEAPAAPVAPASAPAPVPAPITVVRTAAARTGSNGDFPVQPVGTFNFGKVKRHPPHLPYDPKVHVHFKPPFSFSCLIFMSIEDSPQKAMPVKEIYNWIQEHFPFYQAAPIGWKNSVRHNLSLNKCFRKVEKSPGPGKGSLWTVDPLFRPHLIQALKRSPCVQETPAGAASRTVARPWSAAASALGSQPLPLGTPLRRTAGHRPATSAPPPPPPPPAEGADDGLSPAGLADDSRSTESLEAAVVAAVPVQPGTAVPRMTPRRRPSRGAKRTPSGQSRSQSDESGPNPDLFPLLSRRLQSGGSSPAGHQGGATSAAGAPAVADDGSGDGEPQLMIVQEPPPPETPPARCRAKVVKRTRESTGFDYDPVLVPTPRVQPVHFVPQPAAASSTGSRLHPRVVVIRRSPEEEHTYARDPLRRQSSPQRPAHHVHSQSHPLLSDDEAFSDDSNLSIHDMSGRTGGSGGSSGLSPEEAGIRFVQEGADLLLNLAGVSSGPSRTVTVRRGAGRPPGRGRGRGAAAGAGVLR